MRFAPLLALMLCASAWAQESIADKTKGLTPRAGLIESFLDAKNGKALLRFPAPKGDSDVLGEYLYAETLATGLGQNDLGLDRGEPGKSFILNVRLIANKVLFEIPNYSFRASSPSAEEKRAARESFATSVVWAAPVAARDADGSILVDITDFLVRDAHGVALTLDRQGTYTLDSTRSVLNPAMCKAFPNNLEFEALLTFRSARANPAVGNHAPESEYVTMAQRHSFVRLPDATYKPRGFDPRAGSFGISYLDFSAPLGEPMARKLIARHRLETNAQGVVKKPIVYYVERGVPEPIRTALIEGGNYWKAAFEAAGFKDAYRVELMPEGMDPMDVRYNVVHWTNRSTRGWAYGSSVEDPRTGEIIRGVVNLDSQRARQDVVIFESLVGVDQSGKGGPNDPIQVALSRIRQLSAHEIGHTLGFQHNFAASPSGRASVMDYPAPLIKITPAGELDLTDAYAQGIGDWDKQLVRYAYSEFPSGSNEPIELRKIVEDGIKRGLLFLSDADATESSGSDPRVNRWDNGNDPIAGLQTAMKIRDIGMKRFGERNIRVGQPVANLEIVFGPLYFFHRYDVDGVAKLIGGNTYQHAIRGDGQSPQQPVPAEKQVAALAALLECLQPEFLNVPPTIAALMGVTPNGYGANREEFAGNTTFSFDTVAAASSAADLVLIRLLDPQRSARIVELSARNPGLLTLDAVLKTVVDGLVEMPSSKTPMEVEIGWAVQQVLATRLMDLATVESPGVRSRAVEALRHMLVLEGRLVPRDPTGQARELREQIQRFLTRPLVDSKRPGAPAPALPGQPIGGKG